MPVARASVEKYINLFSGPWWI